MVHIEAQRSLELRQNDSQFSSWAIKELKDTYPIAPKSDVLLLIKELDSTDTVSYLLDEIVEEVCMDSWICIMKRIIKTPFNANMLGVQHATGDYHTWHELWLK